MLLPGEHRVLVAGWYDGTTLHATTEILDIGTMKFSPGPVMSPGRASCAVISLSGSILVVGDYDGHAVVKTTVLGRDALSFQTMTFAAGPAMRTARERCAASILPQDHSPRCALVAGGRGGTSLLATREVLPA